MMGYQVNDSLLGGAGQSDPGVAVLDGFQVLAAAIGAQPVQRHHLHGDDGQRPERVGRDKEHHAEMAEP
jgi:hypothetical protein